jgi:DNA uptake protein ComE-like DNA-binding protein
LGKKRPDNESSADAWLPEELKRRSHDTGNGAVEVPGSTGAEVEQAGAEAQEWLADEPSAPHESAAIPPGPARQNGTASTRAGREAAKSSSSATDATEPTDAEQALIAQRARIDELAEALSQRDAELSALESAKERLSKEHEKREADLEKRFIGRQAALEKQLEKVEERLDSREQSAIAKPAQRSSRRKGKLDLNEATFEQLRDMGLSVTVSARVMAYRDVRQGFQSLDELDEIPGLSVELKRVLREQLTVD